MTYMAVKQAAQLWGILDRRIRTLCKDGKILGTIQEGRARKSPLDSNKHAYARYKKAKSLLPLIDEKMAKLANLRPLTEGELERLNEDFTVEYTYNSNAIENPS